VANVSEQTRLASKSGPQAVPSLAALRRARTNREALLRRVVPVGIGALVVVVIATSRIHPGPGLHGVSLGISIALGGFLLSALGGVAALLLHRFSTWPYIPMLGLLVVSSAVLVWLEPSGPGAVGMLIAVGLAARIVPGKPSMILLAASLAFFVAAQFAGHRLSHGQNGLESLITVIPLAAVYILVLFGQRFRLQETQTERLLMELEETRGAELRAAALAERQRLARDMHDVLAHSLSGLVLQLEGARLLALADPADGRLAGTIDRAHELAKSGLDEARWAIGMLRDDELPGPDRLAALTEAFEADTGVPCRFTSSGTPGDLASPVRLALYRVTQEALTNVRKHARPDRIEVRLDYLPREVTLAVEDFAVLARGDDPPEPPALGGKPFPPNPLGPLGPLDSASAVVSRGYGLTGMRERAELLGGTLTAGPTGGGFLVLLKVPA
jgi:signal transduction histidine kinase